MTAEDILESHKQHGLLQQQIEDGKLSTDTDITARIDAAVSSATETSTASYNALNEKLTLSEQARVNLEVNSAKQTRSNAIRNEVSSLKEAKPRAKLSQFMYQQIEAYMNPDDASDTAFYELAPGEDGKRKIIVSENAQGQMGANEFVNNFMLKNHEEFFEETKSDTPNTTLRNGQVDYTKLRGSALLAAADAAERQQR